ncbi:MAG: ABC transporter substrate-binding protein [Terriglobales bacterium]
MLLAAVLAFALPGVAQQMPTAARGRFGGQLTVPLASAPQTFNPVLATDSASQLVASLTMADLMHINPRTLLVEPALATAVDHVSARRWILHLRHGVRFSDGSPFTAADVVFSFGVYTDPKIAAPERQLLTMDGQPIRARALNPSTVELDLPGPVAVGDRLFDSVWMLPRHRLEAAYRAGHLENAWGPGTSPATISGLGPFQLQQFTPAGGVRLARNRYFWKNDASGHALPFLDQLHLPVVSDPNLRLNLMVRGEVDGLSAIASDDFARLQHNRCCRPLDAGAGLNSEVMVLNLDHAWFSQQAFRQAVSAGIDRANLVRNVYQGHAHALASLTSPGAGRWADPTPATRHDPAAARKLLRQAGYSWRGGRLLDPQQRPVAFSLIVPSTNAVRMHMAVFLQEDLRQLGMVVQVVPLDFNSYVDRLMHRRDFEAALVGFQILDADPNEESNMWALDGAAHFWDAPPAGHPLPAWEQDLARWFHLQLQCTDPAARLKLYRQIQATEHAQLPLIPLIAPDVLAVARPSLAGVAVALLPPHLLWNADQLYWPAH